MTAQTSDQIPMPPDLPPQSPSRASVGKLEMPQAARVPPVARPSAFSSSTSGVRGTNGTAGGTYLMSDMVKTSLFLSRVYVLARQNDEDTAIDEIFNFIDDALLAEDFGLCVEVFTSVNARKLSTSLAVSFLMVSKAAKPHIPSRSAFFARVMESVSDERGAAAAHALLDKYE